MTNTTARIKQAGENFEIIVDLDGALKFKKGYSKIVDFLEIDEIYSDSKKGFKASEEDLEKAFKTTDVNEIAKKIVKDGEILVTKEYRDEEKEKKIRQVVDFLVKNAIDPRTGNPYTPERIKNAMEEASVNIKNESVENQIKEILEGLSRILPIKLETKKVKINLPAIYTGKAYGLVSQYKEKENWLNNGGLEIIINIPAGMIMNFYDKLNSITHGSALTEEIKE